MTAWAGLLLLLALCVAVQAICYCTWAVAYGVKQGAKEYVNALMRGM